MTKQCAVFSCLGLGDGLIALVLSNNLQLNGYAVTTFHPSLDALQEWFPHICLKRFPAEDHLFEALKDFDHFFFIYEKSAWMQSVLTFCSTHFPDKMTILNPIATTNRDYPYWENGRFDGSRPFVDNLYVFCKDLLRLPMLTKSNGIVIPENVKPRHEITRIVLHPMSSRDGKNWPQAKYLALADHLRQIGLRPVFILTEKERQGWPLTTLEAPEFSSLSEMTAYIGESGYMIGNDSGIGHLASCLGLPTVTICRSLQIARFWRPAWMYGKVIAPSPWIPNIKGLRWRDRHWKKWISVKSVVKSLAELQSAHNDEV